jgi:hypothetical protein
VTLRAPAVRRRKVGLTALKIVLALVAGGILFVLGIGLGQALEETPPPGGTRTQVRTLEPLPLTAVTETVTVTIVP